MVKSAPYACRWTLIAWFLAIGLATGAAWAAPFDDLNIKLQPSEEPAEPPQETPPEKLEAPQRPELETPNKPNDALAAARLAFQQKNFSKSLELLIVASAQQPGLPPPRLMLADMYLNNNMRLSGRALMERVAVEDPQHPELWRLFGSLALAEQRWTEASMHFARALELHKPDAWTARQRAAFDLSARQGLAAAAERRGDWPAAAEALGQIVQMAPGSASAHDRWASALFNADFTDKAYEQFKVSYLLDRNMSPPELSMGILCINDGAFQRADNWFARAIAAQPKNAMLRYQISVALMVQDRAKEAAVHAAQAAELGLESADLNMVRGYAARQLNVAEAAERFFRAVLHDKPDDDVAKDQLALVLIESSDEAKQQEALELARAVTPTGGDVGRAQATLGWVQYRLGHVAEADALLEKAVQNPNLGPDSLLLVGRFCQEQQRADEAQRVAQYLAASLSRAGIFATRPAARRWLQEFAGDGDS